MLLESFDGCLKDIVVAHPRPTAHQRTLPHLGHVGKAVIVIVVRLVEYFIVTQQCRAPTIRQVQVRTEVRLQLSLRIKINVCVGKGCGLRFLELHIDLSRDALIAVFD